MLRVVAAPNRFLPPLIATNVHKDSDQPRLFAGKPVGNRMDGARRFQEGVLHHIKCIVCTRRQPAGKPVEPVSMQVKKGTEAFCRVHI